MIETGDKDRTNTNSIAGLKQSNNAQKNKQITNIMITINNKTTMKNLRNSLLALSAVVSLASCENFEDELLASELDNAELTIQLNSAKAHGARLAIELQSTMTALGLSQTRVTEADSMIADLHVKIEELENDITINEATIAELNAALDVAENEINEGNVALANLQVVISDISDELTSALNAVEVNEDLISSLQDDLAEALAGKQDVENALSGAYSTINSLSSQVANLNGQLDAIAAQDAADALAELQRNEFLARIAARESAIFLATGFSISDIRILDDRGFDTVYDGRLNDGNGNTVTFNTGAGVPDPYTLNKDGVSTNHITLASLFMELDRVVVTTFSDAEIATLTAALRFSFQQFNVDRDNANVIFYENVRITKNNDNTYTATSDNITLFSYEARFTNVTIDVLVDGMGRITG